MFGVACDYRQVLIRFAGHLHLMLQGKGNAIDFPVRVGEVRHLDRQAAFL